MHGVAQGDELAPRMRDALQQGKLGISALSPRVTTGKEQWQEWHHDFFHNQMEDAIQACKLLICASLTGSANKTCCGQPALLPDAGH
jgi:hypothetical protein